jgi:hypothetical protein
MPDTSAELIDTHGKKVTITIAEIGPGDPPPPEKPNTFSMQIGDSRLTITIAE